MTPCFLIFQTHWDITMNVNHRSGCFVLRNQCVGERWWKCTTERSTSTAGETVCWSMVPVLTCTLTEIVGNTPRDWTMPNCHFYLEKRDLEWSRGNRASRWPPDSILKTWLLMSPEWVFSVPSSGGPGCLFPSDGNSGVVSCPGWQERDRVLSLALHPLFFFFFQNQITETCVCVYCICLSTHCYDTVIRCLLFDLLSPGFVL